MSCAAAKRSSLWRSPAPAMVIDGETVALQPGRYALVEPAAQRQVVAGPEGLSYLVVGARVEAAQA